MRGRLCYCCMMFNMPDRGRLAEVLHPGRNAAVPRSLDGKSCLHPIFHFARSCFFFICIHISASLLLRCTTWSHVNIPLFCLRCTLHPFFSTFGVSVCVCGAMHLLTPGSYSCFSCECMIQHLVCKSPCIQTHTHTHICMPSQHTHIHTDTPLQEAGEYSVGGGQASVAAHTYLSRRGYVTYSAISNDLNSQVLAVMH